MSKIDKIVDHKLATKKKLNTLRRKYLYHIYKGFLDKDEWYKIHDKLLKETVNYRKIVDVNKMYAVSEYIFRESQKYRNDSNMPLVLFLFLDTAYHLFAKPINSIVNTEENILKSEYLTNMINDARDNKQIFYLCSKHNDCAKDHLDYQGKIYVDEKWDWYDNEKKVLDFVNENRIPTIQWVIDRPVWLISRPNCRHFFVPLTTEEVLNNSVDKLIEKHDLSFETGYQARETKEQAVIEKLEFYKKLYSVSKGKYILEKINFYEKYLRNIK